MKYDADLLKESKLPVTFHAENGNLYSYASTTRYEAFDEIEVKEKPEKDFYIGFNPSFLVDIMSIVDSEYPVFYGTKEVCPWIKMCIRDRQLDSAEKVSYLVCADVII